MPGAYLPIATTAGAQGVASPDCCNEPNGSGVDVPTPFVNTASGAIATGTSTKTLVVKQPALLMASTTASTQGDEAGVDRGLASGTTAGPSSNLLGSTRVLIEGRGVVLVGHTTGQNGASPNATGAVVSASNVTVLASP